MLAIGGEVVWNISYVHKFFIMYTKSLHTHIGSSESAGRILTTVPPPPGCPKQMYELISTVLVSALIIILIICYHAKTIISLLFILLLLSLYVATADIV